MPLPLFSMSEMALHNTLCSCTGQTWAHPNLLPIGLYLLDLLNTCLKLFYRNHADKFWSGPGADYGL